MAHLPTSVAANFSTQQQNNTNNTTCPKAELNEWYITVVPGFLLLITVLGVVLNVFVLLVFCLHKKACTMAEIYLSNMAAADLLLTAFLPFWAGYIAKNLNWTFGYPLCQLVTLSINMNAYCSIYFLVLISIDRYVALVHPLSHEGLRRPKYAKLGCLLVWCFGLFVSVPTLVYRDVTYSDYTNSTVCHLKYPTLTENCVFTVMLMTLGFIIPLFIISFCTFRIIQALKNRSIVGSNAKKREQKATTLMLAVLLAFMICWVPLHLVKIVLLLLHAKVLTDCTISTIVYTCASSFMYLAFFNSVLNPILYIIVGKNFRKKARELFKQWSINRTTTLSSTTTTHLTMLRSVRTEV